MPRSATTCAARSGKNTWCWSPCRARPPPCARGGGRRPRARRGIARGLCRAAHPVLRQLAAGNDDLDAPRPAAGQAARSALALGRRGRSRRRGRRADADEPRGARYPAIARGRHRAEAGASGSLRSLPRRSSRLLQLEQLERIGAPDLAAVGLADLRLVEPAGGIAEVLERVID